MLRSLSFLLFHGNVRHWAGSYTADVLCLYSEVPASSFGLFTDYPELGASWYFSACRDTCRQYVEISNDCLLPNPYVLSVHNHLIWSYIHSASWNSLVCFTLRVSHFVEERKIQKNAVGIPTTWNNDASSGCGWRRGPQDMEVSCGCIQ
jgi:hypothetical protein